MLYRAFVVSMDVETNMKYGVERKQFLFSFHCKGLVSATLRHEERCTIIYSSSCLTSCDEFVFIISNKGELIKFELDGGISKMQNFQNVCLAFCELIMYGAKNLNDEASDDLVNNDMEINCLVFLDEEDIPHPIFLLKENDQSNAYEELVEMYMHDVEVASFCDVVFSLIANPHDIDQSSFTFSIISYSHDSKCIIGKEKDQWLDSSYEVPNETCDECDIDSLCNEGYYHKKNFTSNSFIYSFSNNICDNWIDDVFPEFRNA